MFSFVTCFGMMTGLNFDRAKPESDLGQEARAEAADRRSSSRRISTQEHRQGDEQRRTPR